MYLTDQDFEDLEAQLKEHVESVVNHLRAEQRSGRTLNADFISNQFSGTAGRAVFLANTRPSTHGRGYY